MSRPLQCPICTGLLLNPVTLPCGFSLCQHCLPPLQPIPYQLQVICPFPPCNRGGLHTKEDIGHIDVSLQNLTSLVRTASSLSSNKNILNEEAANARQHLQPDTLYYGQPAPGWDATLDGLFDPYEPVRASYTSTASSPSLVSPTPPPPPHPSSLTYSSPYLPSAQYKVIQPNLPMILASVQHKIQQEIECQVCFLVFCRPITTVCGHTFCKACLIRSLDHKDTCPLCRTPLPLYMHYHNQAPNKILSRFIQYLINSKSDIPTSSPLSTASSGDINTTSTTSSSTTPLASTPNNNTNNNNNNNNPWNISIDESENEIEPSLAMTPLFVNSLIFPRMPCYLLVFEPRYRRLLRNVLKTESKLFGMVLPPRQRKQHHQHHDGIGAWEPSMEYGTLLKIVSFEPLQDGRALVETIGVSRFQIRTYAMLEGYYTATAVELISDIPEEQEVGLEKAVLTAVAHERTLRQEAEKPGSAAESNEEQEEVDFILGSRVPSSPLPGSYEDIDVSTLNSNSSRFRASTLDLGSDLTTTTGAGTSADTATDPLLSSFSSPPGPEDSDRPGTGQWSSRRLLHSTADLSDLHTQDLETLSRRQLMDILLAFVSHMQDRLGPLATQRLQREFGEMVEDNGEYFSFWVASILPVRNYQKYDLLRQTSVRRRLLTVVGWIKEIEAKRATSVCTIS
ncbi:hypothetical protein BG000_002493 [Podila horticola]|nr:hypothetical protein BG000_002493 [Podila horticola]